MFKKVISGFSKFFSKERIIILAVFLILAWALYSYSGSKMTVMDSMDLGTTAPTAPTTITAPTASTAPTTASAPNGYAQQQTANPSELLPSDANSQWTSLNPGSMNQGDVLNANLLQAGYHIGLDTIGQSLRNANLQLRSDPIIPKADAGPWNQSTIEPDLGRVPLEVGFGTR